MSFTSSDCDEDVSTPMFHGDVTHSDTTAHFLLRRDSIGITSSPIDTHLMSFNPSSRPLDTHVISSGAHFIPLYPCNIPLVTLSRLPRLITSSLGSTCVSMDTRMIHSHVTCSHSESTLAPSCACPCHLSPIATHQSHVRHVSHVRSLGSHTSCVPCVTVVLNCDTSSAPWHSMEPFRPVFVTQTRHMM